MAVTCSQFYDAEVNVIEEAGRPAQVDPLPLQSEGVQRKRASHQILTEYPQSGQKQV